MVEHVTSKQWSYIHSICKELGVTFDGMYKNEAINFIEKYKDQFNASLQKKEAEYLEKLYSEGVITPQDGWLY